MLLYIFYLFIFKSLYLWIKARNIRNIAYVSLKEDTEIYVDINSLKFSIFIKEEFIISGIAFIDLNIMKLLVSMHCFYVCVCVYLHALSV